MIVRFISLERLTYIIAAAAVLLRGEYR